MDDAEGHHPRVPDGTEERAPGSRQEWRNERPAGQHQAFDVETVVVPERGQWAVDIVVVFEDEVIRRRIDVYRTERLAHISADLIRRTAARDLPGGPING